MQFQAWPKLVAKLLRSLQIGRLEHHAVEDRVAFQHLRRSVYQVVESRAPFELDVQNPRLDVSQKVFKGGHAPAAMVFANRNE